MINNNERVLAVIPARGGSKGLPGKNIRPLQGKPLIAWSIEAAQQVPRIDRVVVTSDDSEILAVARQWGCETTVRRPAELAGDTITVEPVLCHVADVLDEEFQWILLLQPTSPFRTAADIESILDMAIALGGDPVISITRAAKPPEWCLRMAEDGALSRILGTRRTQQRQEYPETYLPNGALYIARLEDLRKTGAFFTARTKGYRMPPDRSIDIDTALDFEFAEFLLGRKGLSNGNMK